MKKKLLIPLVAGAVVACSSAFVVTGCKDKKPETPSNIEYEQGDAIIEDKDVQYEYDEFGNVVKYTANGKLLSVKFLVKDGSNSYVELRGEKPEEMKVVNASNGITKFSLKEIEESLLLDNKRVSVCEIAPRAFYNCTTLEEVDLTKDNESLNFNIGYGAFEGCTKLTKVTLPEKIYADDNLIGAYAFASCESLTEINLSEKISEIGEYAFKACSSLTTVALPSKVEVIAEGVFSDCDKLTSFTASENLKSIKRFAFADSGLTSVDLSVFGTLRYIGENAFYGIKASSVKVPSSVSYIGTGAFQQIKELSTVEIPFLGTHVADSSLGWSFANTYGYNQRNVPEDERIERNVYVTVTAAPSIIAGAFNGSDDVRSITISSFLADGRYNVYSADGNTINERYEIKANKDIPREAFMGCAKLETVSIPDGVKSIGEYAFYGCEKLSSYTIPSTVQKIGNYAFGGTALTTATIPATVYELGTGLFGNCTALQSLTIEKAYGKLPESVLEEANSINISDYPYYPYFEFTSKDLFNVPSYNTIHNENTYSVGNQVIPDSLTSVTYKHAAAVNASALSGFKSLTNVTVEFAPAEDMLDIEDVRSALILQGTTEISVGSYETVDTRDADDEIIEEYAQRYLFDESAFFDGKLHNAIAQYAFSDCENLTDVTLQNTTDVSVIGISAFNNCKSLRTIEIPASVREIYSQAFNNCLSLSSVTLPAAAEYIGSQAFKDCRALTSISVPASVTTIGDQAFYGCRALTSATIAGEVESLGTAVLGDCINLQNLTIEKYNFIEETTPSNVNYTTKELSTIVSGNLGSLFTTYSGSDYISEWNEDVNNDPYNYVPDNTSGKKLYAVNSNYYVPVSLTTVSLKNVSRVASNAFNGWEKLNTVNLEFVANKQRGIRTDNYTNEVETVIYNNVIGLSAFKNCSNLNSLNITNADKVNGIGSNAFEGCTKLDKADFEKFTNVEAIGERAFAETDIAGNVTIPETVNSLGRYVFYGCPDITGITIKDYDNSISGVTYYDNYSGVRTGSILLYSYVMTDSGSDSKYAVAYDSFYSYNGRIESLFGGENDENAEPQYYYANDSYVPLGLTSVTLEEIDKIAEYALYNMSHVETLKLVKKDSSQAIFNSQNDYAIRNMSGLKTLDYVFSASEYSSTSSYNNNSYAYLSGTTGLQSLKVELPTQENVYYAKLSNLYGTSSNSMPINLRKIEVVGSAGNYYIPANFLYNASYVTELTVAEGINVLGIGENAFTNSHLPMTVHTLNVGGIIYTATVCNNWLIAADSYSKNGTYYCYVPANVTNIADGVISTYNDVKAYYDGTDWTKVKHDYTNLTNEAIPQGATKTAAAKEYRFTMIKAGGSSTSSMPSSITGPSIYYSTEKSATTKLYVFGSGKVSFSYTLSNDSSYTGRNDMFYIIAYRANGTVKQDICSKVLCGETFRGTATDLALQEGDYIELTIVKGEYNSTSSINLSNIVVG